MVIVILAVAVLFGIDLARWALSRRIRQRVDEQLARYWKGAISIRQIDIGFARKSSRAHGVVLRGPDGQPWADARTMAFVLNDWPGLHPSVRAIEVDRLDLTGHFRDGRCRLPLVHPWPKAEGPILGDLERITIDEIRLEAAAGDHRAVLNDKLRLQAQQHNGAWWVHLSRPDEPNHALDIRGRTDPQAKLAELTLTLRRRLDPQDPGESAALPAALDLPHVRRISGTLQAEADLTIGLDQPTDWSCSGQAVADDVALEMDRGLLCESLTMQIDAQGRRFELKRLNGSVLDGQLSAAGHLDLQGAKVTYAGRIAAREVQLSRLWPFLPEPSPIPDGRADLYYDFSGWGSDLAHLSGRGRFFFDDADLRDVPSLRSIFLTTGLDEGALPARSDVEAAFQTRGQTILIRQGRLASPLLALEVEPGGTIQARTGRLDLYVIAAPLQAAANLLTGLPIPGMDLVGLLSQKLLRLHVRGHYTDPPAKLITKEPLKDMEEATVAFFRSCLDSGGQLPGRLLAPVKLLLNGMNPGEPRTRRAEAGHPSSAPAAPWSRSSPTGR